MIRPPLAYSLALVPHSVASCGLWRLAVALWRGFLWGQCLTWGK